MKNGAKMDSLIACFDTATRTIKRIKFTEDEKRLSAKIVERHGHRGLRFVIKTMVDYGLVSETTYYLDCMCVRQAMRVIKDK